MENIFTPGYAAPARVLPISAPVALPAVKIVFPTAPEKPPLHHIAALIFLKTLDSGVVKQTFSHVNHLDSQIFAVPFSNPVVKFSLRPLQKLLFSARANIHHSLLMVCYLLFFVKG